MKQSVLKSVLSKYNTGQITVGTLGGHSALDVCLGAKMHGLKTLVVCQKGREQTYLKHFRARGDKGIVDDVLVLDSFKEIAKEHVVRELQRRNTVFVQSRYFWVYCDFDDIEERFAVPIFGSRGLLRAEERTGILTQYRLLEEAGIRTPVAFADPRKIDRLVIVKASEASRPYERAFFFAANYEDYKKKSRELLTRRAITKESLSKARIEEYCLGAPVNFNYFYSPLTGELELLGTDTRRQTNLDGLIRLPADSQLELLKLSQPSYIENVHISITVKESLLENSFDMGMRFVEATQRIAPPGVIGPFALQGAFVPGPPKEEFVVFDASLRIPGSPGSMFTPYTYYRYRRAVSVGERIAIEIKRAIRQKRLPEVVT